MMTPTIAHATPTGIAWRAPSTRLLRITWSVSRPPLTTRFTATSAAMAITIGQMPYSKKLAVATPSAIQNGMRKAIERKPRAMPTPRISIAVSDETDDPGEHRREAVEQHVDEHRERQDEVPALAAIARPGIGTFLLRQADQVAMAGLEVDHPERGARSRAGRASMAALTTVTYGTLRVSAMMNATAPITGGMIWPPMRGGRLDRAGEHGGIAEALHQRES